MRTPDTLVMLITLGAVLAVIVWFAGYCLDDLAHAREVRYLTRPAWALLIVAAFPIGGMLYLVYGRVR